MVVTTGASVLRTMMTCRPFVSVARNTSGRLEVSLAAARLMNNPASVKQRTEMSRTGRDVCFLAVINLMFETTIVMRCSSASEKLQS